MEESIKKLLQEFSLLQGLFPSLTESVWNGTCAPFLSSDLKIVTVSHLAKKNAHAGKLHGQHIQGSDCIEVDELRPEDPIDCLDFFEHIPGNIMVNGQHHDVCAFDFRTADLHA